MTKILIAEDDTTSRAVLEKYLSSYGDCHIARDGMETIDCFLEAAAAKEPYDLLYLDIMMPKVDGLKVLNVIRGFEDQRETADGDRLKVIIMTAVASMDAVDEAFELGCDAYVSKPIDLAKLDELMESLGIKKVGD